MVDLMIPNRVFLNGKYDAGKDEEEREKSIETESEYSEKGDVRISGGKGIIHNVNIDETN